MDWTAPTPLDYFTSLVAQDSGFALTEAAVALGQYEAPELDVLGVLHEIDALAHRLVPRLAPDAGPLTRLRQLHHFFYEELGFAGNVNDYYSPANSLLHEVLRTRRGIPISLAVLYLEMAGQIGLKAHGVSFPGHFLIKLELPRGEVVIDPMSGHSLSRESLEERIETYLRGDARSRAATLARFLRPATPREIIARMLRNLEAIHREMEDWPRLLGVLQRMVVLLPDECEWRRDRGLALEHLGDDQAAIADLAHYLSQAGPAASDRTSIGLRLARLRDAGPTRWH
jgi:regulator of sirC expression with transglutaminase-like and TPR domain